MTDARSGPLLAMLGAAFLAAAGGVAAGGTGSAAYERTELRFENDGLTLVGSLLRPPGPSLPAVMMIHGSGASGRDNRWAYSIADALARCGVAVLIPDKRGSGGSEGDWRSADFDALAADARAGWRTLREQDGVDPARVGFLGLSQGGHVAPLAAATTPHAAFAVDMVGSAQVMEHQLYDELELAYRGHGLDQEAIDYLQEFARMSFDYIRTGQGFGRYLERHREISAGPLAPATESWPTSPDDPYWTFWRGVHDFDPVPWWKRLVERRVPALVVYGADDENVNVAKSVARLRRELPGDGLTLRVYEGTGHALHDAATGDLRRDVIAETCDWVHAARRPARG